MSCVSGASGASRSSGRASSTIASPTFTPARTASDRSSLRSTASVERWFGCVGAVTTSTSPVANTAPSADRHSAPSRHTGSARRSLRARRHLARCRLEARWARRHPKFALAQPSRNAGESGLSGRARSPRLSALASIRRLPRTQFVGKPRLIPPCDGSSHRDVIAFCRVKKWMASGPYALVSPKSESFQPPKE